VFIQFELFLQEVSKSVPIVFLALLVSSNITAQCPSILPWGEDMDSDGGHATSMQLVSAANGYNYTGDIAHFAVSGNSGVDQENTVLVLFPDAHNPADREVLFTTETNEELAIWEGAKLDKKQATAATGVTNIQWTPGFERTFLCR